MSDGAVLQQQIQAFVVRFLRESGIPVQISGASLRAELPTALAAQLQVSEALQLCFAPEDAQSGEYITFGHPLLDRMLAMAKERGLACSLLFTAALEPEFLHLALCADPFAPAPPAAPRAYRRLTAVMQILQFPNATFRLGARRLVHQLQVLFYFRVSLVSDEKREMVIPVLVDAVTEGVDTLVNVRRATSFFLTGRRQAERRHVSARRPAGEPVKLETLLHSAAKLPGDSYSIIRLYRKACEHLEAVLGPDLAAYEAEVNARLAGELARIEDYYNGLARELLDPLRKHFHRMASLSVRTQLARSYEAQDRYAAQLASMKQEADQMETAYAEELKQLAAEKERHCSELVAKHQIRVELHLTNVAVLRVPRVEYSLRLNGPSRREIVFLYDVLRERLLELTCDVCDEPLQQAYLCSCGNLVCAGCHSVCSCGTDICAACAGGECHVCAARLCPSCAEAGPCAAFFVDAPSVCAHCRWEECPSCARLAGFAPTVGKQVVSDERMSG